MTPVIEQIARQQTIWGKDPNIPLEGISLERSRYPSAADVWAKAQHDIPNYRAFLEAKGGTPASGFQLDLAHPESAQILAANVLEAMYQLDVLARDPDIWRVSQEIASQQTLFWYLSKPGLYHYPRKLMKPDKYHNLDFAFGMERKGLDATTLLALQFAAVSQDRDLSIYTHEEYLGFNAVLNQNRGYIRRLLATAPIHFLYMGTQEETNSAKRILQKKTLDLQGLTTPVSFVPEQLVDFADSNQITNTLDQVRLLEEYVGQHPEIKQIVTVMYAPHAVRMLHMLEQHDPLTGIPLYIFPLPTPVTGHWQYPRDEATGILVYHDAQQAAAKPLPHKTPLDWQP